MPRQDVHPRQLELVRPVGVRGAAALAARRACHGDVGADVARRVDQEVRREIDRQIVDAVPSVSVARQQLPIVRQPFRDRDLETVVGFTYLRVVRDQRAVGRREALKELIRSVVGRAEEPVDARLGRRGRRRRVRVVRISRHLQVSLAAVRIHDRQLGVCHQLAIDAEAVLVGVRPAEVRIDRRRRAGGQHAGSGLLARLELEIVVVVVPVVGGEVVRVRVDEVHAAAAD